MIPKRIQMTAGVLLMTVLLLFVRLFIIQICGYQTYRELAVSQREMSGFSQKLRGTIYDRNMIPLTGRSDMTILLVEPARLKDSTALLQLVRRYSAEDEKQVLQKLQDGRLFSITVTDGGAFDGLEGVYAIRVPQRYEAYSPLAHVVGYANADNAGVSGVESTMNGILYSDKQLRVVQIADSQNNQIKGLSFKITGQDTALPAVRLTLDYRIQKAVFDATADMEKGSAVVVDVESGDVLAMVSRPNYDQNNVAESMVSEDGELNNRALLSYNAGSVFKIVVACSAIEQSSTVLKETFHCDGFIDVYGRKVACHKAEGHGIQNFTQAFANSCNPAFIETGTAVGKQAIIEMAHRFGFGEKTDILPGSVEQNGVVTKVENNYPLDCANLSIGQGDLMVTPLQVVSMTATIASGGIKRRLNLLDCVTDTAGNQLQECKVIGEERVIHVDTAEKVKKMMRETAVSGTGQSGDSAPAGGVSAKTGSAQTGWVVNGKTLVHAWYTGFFPYENPKYAVVVFVEGGESGSGAAGPIFKRIADAIAQLDAEGIK